MSSSVEAGFEHTVHQSGVPDGHEHCSRTRLADALPAGLQDDPFPRAEVRELAALEFDEATSSELVETEPVVRAPISRASEFVDVPRPPNIELSPELGERIWQAAG